MILRGNACPCSELTADIDQPQTLQWVFKSCFFFGISRRRDHNSISLTASKSNRWTEMQLLRVKKKLKLQLILSLLSRQLSGFGTLPHSCLSVFVGSDNNTQRRSAFLSKYHRVSPIAARGM